MPYMTHFPDRSRWRSITPAQLNEADEERRLRACGLLDQLDRMGLVPYQTIPAVDTLDGFLFDPEAVKRGERDYCLKHKFLFLSMWQGATTMAVALVDPHNIEPIDAFVNSWWSRFFDPVVVPEAALLRAIHRVYHRSWVAPPRPSRRLEDRTLAPIVEAAANAHFSSLDGLPKSTAVTSIVDTFKEDGPKWTSRVNEGSEAVPCAFCGREPVSKWYTNVIAPRALRNDPPVFLPTMRPIKARPPAICQECVTRDWKAWEADVEAVVAALRRGGERERAAADELARRFGNRRIRVSVGKCDFCGARGAGVRAISAFACATCAAEAKKAFEQAHTATMKRMDDEKRREEEEKNRPFPDEMREEARREAARLGARRARAMQLPPDQFADPPQTSGKLDESWEEVRRWFKDDATSYIYMKAFRERAWKDEPPAEVVDDVAGGIITLIESVALDGYRRRHKGMLERDKAVVGERWPAQDAIALLAGRKLSVARRARVDEAILLLRKVLDSGVHYYEYDRPMYDDVTEHYARLTAYLYDYRMPLASTLSEGALLLHGGTAEERLEVAREIHLSRTGGSDAEYGIHLRVVDNPGGLPALGDIGNSTLFIANPLAMTSDDQAALFYRLSPTGPPQPTILGADDEEAFRQIAQSTFMERLLGRLYTFVYDLRREAPPKIG